MRRFQSERLCFFSLPFFSLNDMLPIRATDFLLVCSICCIFAKTFQNEKGVDSADGYGNVHNTLSCSNGCRS